MKWGGMLVVLFRGVNFRFWTHLGCSGQNTIIFSRKGLVQGCTRKKLKKIYLICIFLMHFIYSSDIIRVFSFVCVLTWSLLGVKKSLGHAQIGILQWFNSKFTMSNPTPFICRVSPPPSRVISLPKVLGTGGTLSENARDACHLALGQKLQIFVSPGVFRMESQYFYRNILKKTQVCTLQCGLSHARISLLLIEV